MPLVLPSRFLLSHDVAFNLHDLLAGHVTAGEEAGLLSFEVTLRDGDHSHQLESLKGEALWQWLGDNGYRDVLDRLSFRHLLFGLVSDMCHFLHTGLRCCEKGKLSVAFASFRKPIQDNLFYLEWLLADWPDFLAKFRGGPDQLDLGRMPPDKRKAMRLDIIGRAMDKTAMGRWLAPEFLYELRYEKAADVGLDPIFNQALHLVTTVKHYATEPENVNFIFCDDDDREGLWEHLYLVLPTVLLHALYVVRTLFKTFTDVCEPPDGLTDFWLVTGFLLAAESSGSTESRAAIAKTFREMAKEMDLPCPACSKRLSLARRNRQRLWDAGELFCKRCQLVIPLVDVRHVDLADE